MIQKLIAAGVLLSTLGGMPEKSHAQGQQYAYRIWFANKNGSPALSNPAAFLTPRALARRSRQRIAVTNEDRPVSPFYTDSAVNLSRGVLHLQSRWFNYIVVLTGDTAGMASLRAKNWVTSIEPAGYFSGGLHNATPPVVANNTSVNPLPLLRSTANSADYNYSWTQTHLVKGEALHDAGFNGSGMLIAVLDEGYPGVKNLSAFQSLRTSGRIVDSFSFVYRSANSNVFSGGAHGTQVLSTMAAYQVGTYIGAAPGALYALYNTENNQSEQRVETDHVVAALERADSMGADVVNISGGYNTFNYPQNSDYTFPQLDGRTTLPAQAVNLASARGMICVVAAGNEGGNPWQKILTPADADSALTVGNVASNGVADIRSGYGPNASGRIKPEVVAMGVNAAVITATGLTSNSGTSFSAPQIAGYAACLWQAFPNKTASEIRQAIIRTGNQYTNPDVQTGYGIPDFSRAFTQLDVRPLPASEKATAFYNPQTHQVVIRSKSNQSVTMQLYDISGQKLAQQNALLGTGTNYNWALPETLSTGIYLLRITPQNEQWQQVKLTVNR